jgi:hypothetical protein
LASVNVRLRRLACSLAGLTLLGPAIPANAAAKSPAERLAERYAPIAMLREQEEPPCETSAEQYQPTSVQTVLGNPGVELTRLEPDGHEERIAWAPSAAEIASKGDNFHLNLPGNPLGDTCVYARDFARLKDEGRAPAVVYAHVAHQAGRSGLALQYWFFWYFNQFNDLHEGDWEGMQIAFEADTPRQALHEEPSETIVFQHAGGERAGWGDSKVSKDGTHPIVYPAAGSHATFYDSTVYLGNGSGGSGVGCDNTSPPVYRLPVRPILVPTFPTVEGRFKWLTYFGHWGQKEASYNNGPTGPATKRQWLEPFSWMEEQRTTSPRLPGGSLAGTTVTSAFCGAVSTVTGVMNLEAESHWAAVGTIAAAALLLALFFGLTRWGPVDLDELRARRAFGQIVRAARQLYGRHWRTMLPAALSALLVIAAGRALAWLATGARGVDSASGRSGAHLGLADTIETFGLPVAEAIAAAVVIMAVRLLIETGRMGIADCWRGVLRRFWRVVGGQLLAMLGVFLMAITVIGIPFAVWKLVGWQFVQQEILFEDKRLRDAFRGSSALVRGRWWHTVRVAGFFWALSAAAGPVLGFALIFTSFPLIWINAIGALVFALLVPYVALGRTLLYFDLQARAAEQPAKRWRERLARQRPATAEA